MIYLDNAATTFPKPESVYVAMDKTNRELGVNAGRGSYKLAREASKLISETKCLLRQLIHADVSASIVFSPSVTIAMNQIVNGIEWNKNAIVYVSPYEHNAVARTVHKISSEKHITVKMLPIDENTYEIAIEKVKYEFSKNKPDVVFCTHVSNVTGYILPVEEIFAEAKKYKAITILDSAQSLGLIDFDVKQLNVDMIAFAGHKTLYGPLGIGGFINVSHIPLKTFVTGGTGSDSLNLDMPDGIEAKYEVASSNISAIAGLNAALKVLDVNDIRSKELELTNYLVESLRRIKGVEMLIPANLDQHVGIVSFTYSGMSSEDIGTILDEDFDIAVRTGYHCAPYIHDYLDDKKSLGTVRVGLSQFSRKSDIDALVNALKELND
ncbi:MAG: aminotransferase class V-fold PLP-dependent enzyme [Mobilitalea sp.]